MKLIKFILNIESQQFNFDLPTVSVGDTVRVGVTIQEGNKKRIQPYEGTVIAQHRAGTNTTITVRRIFQGIGVERVFPLHSSAIQEVKVLRQANVRKAKLYFLKNRVGKATRLKEKFALTKK